MISSWFTKIIVGFAIVGLALFELGSPLVTKAILDSQVHDAADDAAHDYFQNHDVQKAQDVATQDAENGHAKLQKFDVDDQGVVHVTLFKKAKSYLLYRFSQTKDWYNVRVSASAVPK